MGGGVEDLRAGSRVARGKTAARGAELGAFTSGFDSVASLEPSADVGAPTSLDCPEVSGTLDCGWLTMAPGKRPSASAAVALDIQGYRDGVVPLGKVGGGLEDVRGAGKLGTRGAKGAV
ncbi:MAG: hypothetical protein QM784_06160 [Polyangiaceae bacterium]